MIPDATSELATYRLLWKQPAADAAVLPLDYPGWPKSGFAVLGDFAGIQNFVFRPVPGAGGAARRLRSRSFRVSAYAEMVQRWCQGKLSQGTPQTLYSAGGRFLLSVLPFEGFQSIFAKMQSEVDQWTSEDFGGELVFHLAAVPFHGGRIPYLEVQQAMEAVRGRPLATALLSTSSWSEAAFFQAAATGDGKCNACGMTRPLRTNADGEEICDGCLKDETLGRDLPRARWGRLSPYAAGNLSALGTNMELHQNRTGTAAGQWLAFEPNGHGGERWRILRHLPLRAGVLKDFEEIAEASAGPRKWLGYLRIDGDSAGKHFAGLHGDPLRTWALSRLMNSFFVDTANRLLSTRFQNIYAVYGGGDDLFLVGAWNEALDFALELERN